MGLKLAKTVCGQLRGSKIYLKLFGNFVVLEACTSLKVKGKCADCNNFCNMYVSFVWCIFEAATRPSKPHASVWMLQTILLAFLVMKGITNPAWVCMYVKLYLNTLPSHAWIKAGRKRQIRLSINIQTNVMSTLMWQGKSCVQNLPNFVYNLLFFFLFATALTRSVSYSNLKIYLSVRVMP